MEYTYVYILIITWWLMVKHGEGIPNRSSSEVDDLGPLTSLSAAEFLYHMF